MAFDYLVDNALRNVWCAPAQEKQGYFQLARLTPNGGVLNSYQVMWQNITLPTQGDLYHLYQIGQVNPLLLGLAPKAWSWQTISSAMNAMNLIVDIYDINGYQFPRFQSYYMVTPDKAIILAVKIQPNIPVDLDTEALYFRCYSNAYFNSSRARLGNVDNYIQTAGVVPQNNTDILTIQNTITALSNLTTGACYAFVNGYKLNQINVLTVAIGDVVEYVYDSSIYLVVDFPFENLPTFNSTLDNKYKFLLHYDGASDNVIDYEGDIDVWIYYNVGNGVTEGVYYHHNNIDAIRNVTHRDYSIPTAYVAGFVAAQDSWTSSSDVTVRLHIRRGGFARPLMYETNRILDLYTLPDQEIMGALVGVNSTLVNWQAATLEASEYVQLMGATSSTDVTRQMVEDAYGYNAVANLVGATPLIPTSESGQLIVTLPYNLQSNSTAWEYDASGTLLGFYAHTSGGAYTCANSNCALVEVLAGTASQQIDDTYAQTTQTLDTSLDYRMYMCPINQSTGQPTYVWEDVTSSSYYSILNGVLTWNLDSTQYYTLVRSNKTMLAYTLYIQPTEGVLEIQLQQEGIVNYLLQLFAMQIPMGQLDVFVNGRTLIPGLGYVMNFPSLSINDIDSLYYPESNEQTITIRWQGFCNSDLSTPTDDTSIGFVQYGLLGNTNQYTILDDEVLRISVGGGVQPMSALLFPENSADILTPSAGNGSPYMIQKVVVPMLGVTNEDTYSYRAKSKVIDSAVTDYMTQFYPLPTASGPDVINGQYQVFSPFCCKIIYDLVNGTINQTPLQSFYNDTYVRSVCAAYEYLLEYDPTQPGNQPDARFVVIRPHNLNVPISLNLYCYNFLVRVMNLYLNGLVSLNGLVTVAALGGAQGTGGQAGSD
jgi:hypothetical protein